MVAVYIRLFIYRLTHRCIDKIYLEQHCQRTNQVILQESVLVIFMRVSFSVCKELTKK